MRVYMYIHIGKHHLCFRLFFTVKQGENGMTYDIMWIRFIIGFSQFIQTKRSLRGADSNTAARPQPFPSSADLLNHLL